MSDVGGKHPWLFRRKGKWYLRARVPKDVPNHPKTEVKKALGTSDYREACRLIHAAADDLSREFDEYRRHGGPAPRPQPARVSRISRAAPIPSLPVRYTGEGRPPEELKSSEELTDGDIRSFAAEAWRDWQGWILAIPPTSDIDWVSDHIKILEGDRWEQFQRPIQTLEGKSFPSGTALFLEKRGYFLDANGDNALVLEDYLRRAGSEAYRRKIARLRGAPELEGGDRFFDNISTYEANSSEKHFSSEATRAIVTLNKVIDLYEGDPKRRDIEQKTRREDQRTFVYMKEIFGADRPINQISRQDCIRFRNIMLSIPKNAYREFRGIGLQELQDIARKDDLKRLTNKGANKYIHKLSALMNFAIEQGLIGTNPAFRLAVPARHSIEDRDPFSAEVLAKIFSSDTYIAASQRKFDPDGASWFWVPLLSLFMGLRLGEACQLHVTDVKEVFGCHSIVIDDNDLEGENSKRVKTAAAKRVIPIHPVVVEIGFLSFLKIVQKHNHTRLFPDERRGADTYFSPFSKRYSRFLSMIGCKSNKTSFHGFRHNCKEALDEAGVSDKNSNAIGGWTDAIKSAGRKYGSRSKMLALSEAIAKISYPSFPVDLFR